MRVKSAEEDTPFVILPRVLSALALVTFALLFPTPSYAQATLPASCVIRRAPFCPV